MATNPVNYVSSTTQAATSQAASSSGNSIDPEATRQEFISLLVAQLRNQDPLNPADGTQFLSQLTEINNLEQLMNIRQDLDKMSASPTASGGPTGSGGATTTSTSSTNGAAAGSGTPNQT